MFDWLKSKPKEMFICMLCKKKFKGENEFSEHKHKSIREIEEEQKKQIEEDDYIPEEKKKEMLRSIEFLQHPIYTEEEIKLSKKLESQCEIPKDILNETIKYFSSSNFVSIKFLQKLYLRNFTDAIVIDKHPINNSLYKFVNTMFSSDINDIHTLYLRKSICEKEINTTVISFPFIFNELYIYDVYITNEGNVINNFE